MIRLATSPEPHTVSKARSVLAMFKAEDMTVTTPRSIPPPEPNPEPDAALSAQQPRITPTDWDVHVSCGCCAPTNLYHPRRAGATTKPCPQQCAGYKYFLSGYRTGLRGLDEFSACCPA